MGLGVDQDVWFPVFTLGLGYAGKFVTDLVAAGRQRKYLIEDRDYRNSVDRWTLQRQAVEDALLALQVHQADWLMIQNLKAGNPTALGDRQTHEIFMSASKVVHSGRSLSDTRAANLSGDWYKAFLDALYELYGAEYQMRAGRRAPSHLTGTELIAKKDNQTGGEYFVEVEAALEDRLTGLIREFNERKVSGADDRRSPTP